MQAHEGHPKDDPRTVDELISAALSESDEDIAWDAVGALHWRGNAEVLDAARGMCASDCSVERKLGADVLGQLGVPERTFPDESSALLLDLLKTERDPIVLHAVLVALSHLAHGGSTPAVLRFCEHANSDVRHAAVLALTINGDEPGAVDALVNMTRDSDAHVRDWAAFGLGTQLDVDTLTTDDSVG